MAEENMAQFSLVQPVMFSTSRKLRLLALTDKTCLIWEPRFFTKRGLTINVFGSGLGIFDADAVWLGERMATMRRPVAMHGKGVFTLYRFGEQQDYS